MTTRHTPDTHDPDCGARYDLPCDSDCDTPPVVHPDPNPGHPVPGQTYAVRNCPGAPCPFRVFTAQACETCGTIIQGPNGIQTSDRSTAVGLLDTLPAEGWFDLDRGAESCPNCPEVDRDALAQEAADLRESAADAFLDAGRAWASLLEIVPNLAPAPESGTRHAAQAWSIRGFLAGLVDSQGERTATRVEVTRASEAGYGWFAKEGSRAAHALKVGGTLGI